MIKPSIYILLIALISFSCKKEVQEIKKEPILEIKQDVLVSNIGKQLSPEAKEKLKDWKEFQEVSSILERYKSITKSQVLENAGELSLLTKNIADTIRVEVLKRPDMKIRFNVLYNHSLRLEDMASISAIKEEEVSEEVSDLLAAFSSVNDKINSIYKIIEFEKEFDELRKRVIDSTRTEEEPKPQKPRTKKTTRKKHSLIRPRTRPDIQD
ncbi:MAG: hypothetical protein KAH07_06130 [Flavobacteriaceae bacterium]|nr:hypothetical protein [Flavobacteriaceae bacterium]